MNPKSLAILMVTSVFVFAPFLLAQADTIQLINGDSLNGKVLSLNDKEIKIESAILGEVAIQRKNVVSITFGDRKPAATPAVSPAPATPAATTPAASNTADAVLQQLKKSGVDPAKVTGLLDKFGPAGSVKGSPAGSSESPDDVLQQLRRDGIDKGMVKDLKTKLPLLNIPGVGTYFDKTLSGLASGELDLSHIRKDAIKARDGLIDVKKDLGPHGAALDGYLRILDSFIRETDPPKEEVPEKPDDVRKPSQSSGKT